MSQTNFKSKKQQILDVADALEIPVIFLEDIEKHDDRIFIKRSDGKTLVFSVQVRPQVVNSNTQIQLDVKLEGTVQSSINNSL